MFGVGPRARAPVSVPLSLGCVADGSVRTRPAQVLAEVLEGEVARRLEAGLEGLHDDGRVLAGRRGKVTNAPYCLDCIDCIVSATAPPSPPSTQTHPSLIHGFGSGNHPVQTLGHDGNDSSLGLGEAPIRLPELHRATLIHVLQILKHISDKRFLINL